ncbi:hypothetical protein ACH4KC_01435 [Streptomyces griseoaurantiacus]|uniref:hypothetical protein n=1 Tax=Streptomyces griseoaurantiacus TaxID=68213 RepID=UPI0037BC604B
MAEHDSDHEPEERGLPLDEDAAWAAIVAGYGEEPPDPPGAKPFKPFRPVRPVRPVENVPLPEPPGPAAGAGAAEGTGEAGGADAAGGTTAATGPGASGETAESGGPGGPTGPGAVTTPGGIGTPGVAGLPAGAGAAGPAGPGAGNGEEPDGREAPAAGDGGPSRTGRPGAPLGGSISFAPGVGPRDYSPPEGPGGEDDEGHFVPPEPPPLPASDTTARFAWLGAIGGPILLLIAVLLGWDMTWWLTTACIGGFLGGCATLVMRMHPGDEDEDDPGRGAVV